MTFTTLLWWTGVTMATVSALTVLFGWMVNDLTEDAEADALADLEARATPENWTDIEKLYRLH